LSEAELDGRISDVVARIEAVDPGWGTRILSTGRRRAGEEDP
jgi:hypothetical protein